MSNERLNLLISAPEGFEIVGTIPQSYMNDESCLIVRYDIKRIDTSKAINKPNPHAELIAQCEQDKIDYPGFWEKLYQYSFISENKWWYFKRCDLFSSFETYKYRQHPRRENIIAWHACSDEDKKRWQWLFECRLTKRTEWNDLKGCNPEWLEYLEYRLKPRACKVTLQDGTVMEYPEPVRVALEIGQKYFIVELLTGKVENDHWANDQVDKKRLSNSVIHLIEENAKQHLSVLQAVNEQVAI